MKLFFYDLETTGTNPAKHGIHQISAIMEVNGKETEKIDFKVQPNPKAQIDPKALEVGNVTWEQVMAYPSMREVHTNLCSILGKYVNKFDRTDKFFLVGYNNASFDNNFFRGFFLQNNDNYFGSWFWANTIDVMVLASEYLKKERSKMPNFQLSTVAKQFGIEIDESSLHDAFYDVKLTMEIYKKITAK